MDAIEPLISSSIKGPLGIAHLPRLWLKLLLHGAGRLPEGYRSGEGGFDGSLFAQFGIDGAAFLAYMQAERPDYLATERWIEAHARDLSARTIAAWNIAVQTAELPPERAAAWRERFDIQDAEFGHATSLNDLDDWAGIHARLVQSAQ